MVIGIDFDNTLVCYDRLFQQVALERGLIPVDFPANKLEVRNHLRKIGLENEWTEMQGIVYGPQLNEASAFSGALQFISHAREQSIPVYIISHKTRNPYRGKAYDLHMAAYGWLESKRVIGKKGLCREDIFFEPTLADKISRIEKCDCTHFIDDLPELFCDPVFPRATSKVLFDPAKIHCNSVDYSRYESWTQIANKLLLRT